ncbi:MAG TPA: MMPL family transporter [Anaeromyxobacteraceae bacterium]|nr:MMPL family transporter [Anaeromyxobacteraceae bacterium]
MAPPTRLERVFLRVVAMRWLVLAAFALLVPAGVWEASRIRSDGAIGSLVVPSDPDYAATRAFQRIFPEGQIVLLVVEVADPWRPEALARVDAVAGAVRRVAGVSVVSPLDVYRQGHPGFAITPEGIAGLRGFVEAADLFRRQGLAGARHWGLAVAFPSAGPEARDATLAAIDRALEGAERSRDGEGARLRRVGAPYVESWIERESAQASLRWFPVFGLFVVGLALFLYRSIRTLLAILLSLGAAVTLAVGVGRALGFAFTVVSALVPLTVMVTVLASLVYLHSRFVDQPADVEVDAHQAWALANKFLPVTASSIAAVLGFAALSVSAIRPIRQMGLWTAIGLAIGWGVAFTLFPALQKILRTPTGRTVPLRAALYDRLAAALPAFTWCWRWPLLVASLALSAGGVVALFGLPGRVAPMRLGVDGLDYVDPELPIHRDMIWFREHVSGLNVARAWIHTAPGAATDPEVLRGVDRFTRAAEAIPGVSAAVGPTTFLRVRRALAGDAGPLPEDAAAFAQAAGDVEPLLLSQPELRGFIDVGALSDLQVTVTFEDGSAEGFARLARGLDAAWRAAAAAVPAVADASLRVVGESLLQAKVGASLVPTLTESFALTAALIFAAFLVVFRSASARLMAMIPSVFAILCTFLGVRLLGGSLNVATILIATTVLGTTENDQIHFFHHLHEGEGAGGLDGELRHALRVSGRAIFFATLINAAGFLGLAFSRFPPLRQFGLETAGAFLLAMLADFTALPGALWILRRERPHAAAPSPLPHRGRGSG